MLESFRWQIRRLRKHWWFRHLWIIVLVVTFLICMWSWYFLYYSQGLSLGEVPVEKYYWYTDSDKAFMKHVKSYIHYNMVHNNQEFTDYTKQHGWKDYECSRSDGGSLFVFSADTNFKHDEGELGTVDFRQQILCNVTFDEETLLYKIGWKVKSTYKLPNTKEWVEFNAGNGSYNAVVSEKELRSRMNLGELIDQKINSMVMEEIKNINSTLGQGAF